MREKGAVLSLSAHTSIDPAARAHSPR